MSISRRKNSKRHRKASIGLGVSIALLAAASPAFAAPENFAQVDKLALAIIGAFGTLLFAIVFEVWRATVHRQSDAKIQQQFTKRR